MIKFFRHIRQQLLSEGKTANYFKYAIGEIILVVIGILIALQINNWNEQRKADKAEGKALIALKNEFKENIERLSYICEQRHLQQEHRRNYFSIITSDTIPNERKIIDANMKGFYSGKWSVQNTVIRGLVNSGDINNIKNDSLKMLLTLWPDKVSNWNKQEAKWDITSEKLSDYMLTRARKAIPKPNKEKWEYEFVETMDEYRTRKLSYIHDLKYQNFIAHEITHLYIQTRMCDELMEDYQNIMNALEVEIKNRNIN